MALGPEYHATKDELTGAGPDQARAPSLLGGAWATARERDNETLMGIAGGSVESTNKERLFARNNDAIRQREAEKSKMRSDDIIFLQLLEQQIAAWEQEAQDMEDRFASLYGENWREDLASEILDEIPQPLPGESLEDYRDRLENILVENMIDPATGQLKPEYRDHPDPRIREYGLWAETKNNIRQAKQKAEVLRDPNSTPEQKQPIYDEFKKPGNAEQATATADELEGNKKEQTEVQTAQDVGHDIKHSQESVAAVDSNGFLTGGPPPV